MPSITVTSPIIKIIILILAVKLIYYLFAVFINQYVTPLPENLHVLGNENEKGILDIFYANDSGWYEKIAAQGHEKVTPDQLGKCEEGNIEQSYYAFFPLYPLFVGSTMKLAGAGFSEVAFFYSLVFSLLAFILFYKFSSQYFKNNKIALTSTLLLILFPFHYYYSMYYSEALYLVLLIACFFAIKDKKWSILCFLLGFLVLVRPNGVFMTIPLLVYTIEEIYSIHLLQQLKTSTKNLSAQLYKNFMANPIPLLVFAIVPIVFFGYCLYLYQMTGNLALR